MGKCAGIRKGEIQQMVQAVGRGDKVRRKSPAVRGGNRQTDAFCFENRANLSGHVRHEGLQEQIG